SKPAAPIAKPPESVVRTPTHQVEKKTPVPTPAPVVVQEPKPMSESPRNLPSVQPAVSAPMSDALRMTQDNLVVLQRLGEQTAQLHRQFLEGQDRVLGAFQSLLEQQQRLLQGSVGQMPAIALPAPAVIAHSVASSVVIRPMSAELPLPPKAVEVSAPVV